MGWIENGSTGEWEWAEDDPTYQPPSTTTKTSNAVIPLATAPTKLPSGEFKPKQSLGQNFLQDGNTVRKIVRAFASDANLSNNSHDIRAVELGPGAGALTTTLLELFGPSNLLCIEIDERAIDILAAKHPELRVVHRDVLQVDYVSLSSAEGGPLNVIGNLPYYITSQILFALADASHAGAVKTATVTMQWEVAQRLVAVPRTKAYGILSVVFQLYSKPNVRFSIPPTVFYPKPKVESALVSLEFFGEEELERRLGGVDPRDLRKLLAAVFQKRRKVLRNSLKGLVQEIHGAESTTFMETLLSKTTDLLHDQWFMMRPEELTPEQMVDVTALIFGRGVVL